jgi:hypothetical protein
MRLIVKVSVPVVQKSLLTVRRAPSLKLRLPENLFGGQVWSVSDHIRL